MFKLSISFSQTIFPKVLTPNSSSQFGIDCKKALFEVFGTKERLMFLLFKRLNSFQDGNSILLVINHKPNISQKKFFDFISNFNI